MKFHPISELSPALALILMLAGCNRPGQTTDIDPMSPQAVQPNATHLVAPQRYLRLSDLAGAIRKSGHPCEVVRTYKLIEEREDGSAVYKIECLEYSFRLTIINGQSRIERFTADNIRE